VGSWQVVSGAAVLEYRSEYIIEKIVYPDSAMTIDCRRLIPVNVIKDIPAGMPRNGPGMHLFPTLQIVQQVTGGMTGNHKPIVTGVPGHLAFEYRTLVTIGKHKSGRCILKNNIINKAIAAVPELHMVPAIVMNVVLVVDERL
jgi:hypothetical protein